MREAFWPLRYEDVTEEQEKDALEMLIFIKEKRNDTIKARVFADRGKQRKK